ncbi:MAG: T9SS type A sorting domain-containing protein [Bacteroidetes bacterium]|nr:T9SS type A sorting domain-containing protein [Bacteroidota bacterium]
MKSFRELTLLLTLSFILITTCFNNTLAQNYFVITVTGDDVIRIVDDVNMNVQYSVTMKVSGFTIVGSQGMSVEPLTGDYYLVYSVSGSTDRRLGIVNPITGTVKDRGDLGDKFAGITFDNSGVLYGVTGDGATVPESLYTIDPNSAKTVFVMALGNGDGGETIAICKENNMIYHASGFDTLIWEKVDPIAKTVTNITMSGLNTDEGTGLLYLGSGDFLFTDLNDDAYVRDTSGGTTSFSTGSLYIIKGVEKYSCGKPVIKPLGQNPYCTNEILTINASVGNSYQWYKNGIILPNDTFQRLAGVTPATYNCIVINSFCVTTDSALTGLVVNTTNIPIVSLTPPDSAYYNTNDSVLLTGSMGGSSQWFRNGFIFPGADTNFLWARIEGIYNMVKINMNGCSDSAPKGVKVIHFSGIDYRKPPQLIHVTNNPSEGAYLIAIQYLESSSMDLAVYDLRGQRVYFDSIDKSMINQLYQLDLGPVPRGMYILEITAGTLRSHTKLIVQ